MSEITLTLNNPLTDEQWDTITDVDFDHTDRIMFHTKHGKDVEFVKSRAGRWIDDELICKARCSVCGEEWSWMDNDMDRFLFCPNCGSYNRGEDE